MAFGWGEAAAVGLDLAGKLFGGKSSDDGWAKNIDAQRHMDLARPSWVVEGAKAAGLHPLAVLGMGGMSAPVGGIGQEKESAAQIIGTGLSRAAAAYQPQEEKVVARKAASLQVENMELQNARLRSEIALMNQAGTPPSIPTDGIKPSRSTLDNYVSPYDKAVIDAELRGAPEFWHNGSRYWSPSTLQQMEADYLRVPIEYINRAGRDFQNFGQSIGRKLRDGFRP